MKPAYKFLLWMFSLGLSALGLYACAQGSEPSVGSSAFSAVDLQTAYASYAALATPANLAAMRATAVDKLYQDSLATVTDAPVVVADLGLELQATHSQLLAAADRIAALERQLPTLGDLADAGLIAPFVAMNQASFKASLKAYAAPHLALVNFQPMNTEEGSLPNGSTVTDWNYINGTSMRYDAAGQLVQTSVPEEIIGGGTCKKVTTYAETTGPNKWRTIYPKVGYSLEHGSYHDGVLTNIHTGSTIQVPASQRGDVVKNPNWIFDALDSLALSNTAQQGATWSNLVFECGLPGEGPGD